MEEKTTCVKIVIDFLKSNVGSIIAHHSKEEQLMMVL